MKNIEVIRAMIFSEMLFRAVSFGRPVGPWRDNIGKAKRDLIEVDLAEFDEWGKLFIKVPGDVECISRSAVKSHA